MKSFLPGARGDRVEDMKCKFRGWTGDIAVIVRILQGNDGLIAQKEMQSQNIWELWRGFAKCCVVAAGGVVKRKEGGEQDCDALASDEDDHDVHSL